MATQVSRPEQGTKVAPFSYNEILSIYNTRLDTGYLMEIERYGKADRIFDFLNKPEREISISTRRPKVFEMLPIQADVSNESDIATSLAGAAMTFVVATADVSATGATPLNVSEGIIVPGAYTISGNDALFVVQANPSGVTYTLYPADQTEGVATLIPGGTVFKIHGSYKGFETGQPDAKNTKRVERPYQVGLCKTTAALGGGVGALKWLQVNAMDDPSRNGFIAENQYLAEFDHDKKLDDMIFFNQLIDNTNLTETSALDGNAGLRQASKGLWNHAEDSGQILPYAGTWDQGNFYDYKNLAISQLISSREVQFYYGYDLSRQVEQAGLDWIQAYSGGTDLFMSSQGVGWDVKYYQLDGFTFQCKELESFRNVIGLGNQAYNFYKSGIMMPVGTAPADVDGRGTEHHPNIMLGYLRHDGVDRKRSIGFINGPSGLSYPVNTEDDLTKWIFNTEYALFVLRPNQLVLVKPE
jgi:hypothetical protein